MNKLYFVDTHAHITKKDYKDINKVVYDAFSNGVEYIINSGSDARSNKEILKLSKKYKNMYITLGIHPHEANNYKEKDILFIKKHLNNKKVVAIGEIGLDYHYGRDTKKEQIKLFELQLQIAEENNLPVVIHARDSHEDILNCLKKHKVKAVIHSYSDNLKYAKKYVKEGYLLGINGILTFQNSNLNKVLKEISINNIILETDSPYLSPVPLRGKQNEPKNVKIISDSLSKIYNIDLKELAKITNKNVSNLFDKIKLK